MRRVLAVLVAVLALGGLTACGDTGETWWEREDRNARLCIEHGGSFVAKQGSEWSCTGTTPAPPAPEADRG